MRFYTNLSGSETIIERNFLTLKLSDLDDADDERHEWGKRYRGDVLTVVVADGLRASLRRGSVLREISSMKGDGLTYLVIVAPPEICWFERQQRRNTGTRSTTHHRLTYQVAGVRGCVAMRKLVVLLMMG